MRHLAIALLLLGGACTSAGGGITTAEVRRCPDSAEVCAVALHDAKERDHVSVTIHGPDWSATYEARTVRAFEGQRIEAEVRKALLEELGRVPEGVVARVLEAVRGLP